MNPSSLPPTDVANAAEPFGAFAPRGLAKALIKISRHKVTGRGELRRVIWLALRATGQPCFDVCANGVRLRLFPYDNSAERSLLLKQHIYTGERAFLRGALTSAPTLVDAGANIGAMSIPLANIPDLKVVAVEPAPVALARLRFNAAANGLKNFQIDDVALSDADGTIRFFVHTDDAKLSHVGAPTTAGTEIEVRTKTFATLLADHDILGPYVLKIDVERHEDRVLMPFFASTPVDRWPSHVLIETIEREGVPECVSFMSANGYKKTFQTPQNTGLSLVAS